MKKNIKLASWGVVILGSMFGAFQVLSAFFDPEMSWPAAAGTAAIGIGFSVIPYCITRAVNEMASELEI